jgi:tetratricopeptide (TPR) repeat protein
MVDLGVRHGIITPVTSLYVPTKNEMTPDERAELERKVATYRAEADRLQYKRNSNGPASDEQTTQQRDADNKEGGTGTRAKGEEGSMGGPARRAGAGRYGVQGPTTVDAPMAEAAMTAAAVAAAAPAPAAAPMPSSREPNAPPADKAQVGAGEAAPARAAERPSFAKGGADNFVPPAGQPPPPPPATLALGGKARVVTSETAAATADKSGLKQELEKNDVAKDSGVAGDGRWQARGDAAEFGMIGILNSGGERDDQMAAVGNMWGSDIGGANGQLAGIGEGGGGLGDGTGLGNIGTIGHGAADPNSGIGFGASVGKLSGKHAKAKRPEEINKALRDADHRAVGALASIDGKKAKIVDGEPSVSVDVHVDVPHAAVRCGGAAYLAFDERVQLWRERLSRFTGNAEGVASVYRRALALCEAPTWRERGKLYALMLDAMPSVPQKVQLWRVMFRDLGAADALYRGILARVRTPNEMRQLHDALGLRSIDPGLLAKTLEQAKTPELKVKKLRELVKSWPDDFALALKLLDTLEDADDKGGGRELARKLRARPDADARLRTAVGEFYLRAAEHEGAEEAAADKAEAKRAFGEIVEFAPDDPIARRRLGDLLRAHGYYQEAQRQYQTLAKLSPDDPSVALLLAASAEGLGKLEEAVKWTEKGGAAGAPDVAQGPAVTARAFASTYLAWGLLAARDGKKDDEAKAIETRLLRVLATERTQKVELRGPRVSLTWSHPELHPTLWSNALGAPMPAPEGDVTLGIAGVVLPAKDGTFVEVRVEKDDLEHAARLGAKAWLTLLVEDKDHPKVVRIPIAFEADGKATRRFSVADGELTEVSQ